MHRFVLFWLLPLLICCCGRTAEQPELVHVPFLKVSDQKVDSLLGQMTLEEKIGQLIAYKSSAPDAAILQALLEENAAGRLGGVLLEQLPLDTFVWIRDSLRRAAPLLPPFFLTNQLLSLNNQFSDLEPFPSPASISAIHSDSLSARLEQRYLQQCELLGINLALGPDVQPLVDREGLFHPTAFESDPEEILHQSSKRLEALQSRRILAAASLFTLSTAILKDTSAQSRQLLHPFLNLSFNGLSGLLVRSPKKEETPSSPLLLRQALKERLEYQGLLLSEISRPAELEAKLLDGIDLFVVDSLLPSDWRLTLMTLYNNGVLTPFLLDQKVRKILKAKLWMRQLPPVEADWAEASKELFRPSGDALLVQQLYEKALVLAQNPRDLLPFRDLNRRKFHLLFPAGASSRVFENRFQAYADYQKHQTADLTLPNIRRLKQQSLLVCLQDVTLDAQRDSAFLAQLNQWGRETDVAIVNFGDPGNLLHFGEQIALVQLFEYNAINASLAAQLVFGALQAPGSLPLALSDRLPAHQPILRPITRLKYAMPEEVGISSYKLVGIDAIFNSAISDGATPGGQVLVAKNGKIIYSKAFGHHTYRKKRRVRQDDLYDLASITKIAATTLMSMKLYDDDGFKLSDPLNKYIMCGDDSAIRRLRFKNLLTHTSGLQPNMPIAPLIMMRDSMPEWEECFSKERKMPYVIQVADSMYLNNRYIDSMWQEVYDLKPRRQKTYRYSDVNFNLIQKLIESELEKPLDDLCEASFYNPLHLRHTAFRPLQEFDKRQIVPTAQDQRWRKQLLQGHPHDETAALLGGVSGNAGLFSNANDLAILMQLLLNGGHYGGDTLLSEQVIDFFTSSQHSRSHRGLGFDKPGKKRRPSYSKRASKQTYGHTGYTGTCVWVDPTEELIYIFLSNRVHPDPYNKTLFRKQVRQRIHTVIYDALGSFPLRESEQEEEPIQAQAKMRAEML
ncbi:MAG: serine hydrolase [Bacteroidota bacterium]